MRLLDGLRLKYLEFPSAMQSVGHSDYGVARKQRRPQALRRWLSIRAGLPAFGFCWLHVASAAPAPVPNYAEYDARMLWGAARDKDSVDLSRFERGNIVAPGLQFVDVHLNGEPRLKEQVRFVEGAVGGSALPCFSRRQLKELRIAARSLPEKGRKWLDGIVPTESVECRKIDDVVPEASAIYEFGEQIVHVVVPQANLETSPDDYIPAALWDYGIDSARMNYSWNVSHSHSDKGGESTSGFLQLDAGLNLGRWRVRHTSVLMAGLDDVRYQEQRFYVQRNIPDLNSTLTVGEAFVGGQVMDAFGMKGLLLRTDDRMAPPSLRGYAPVVRGIARTSAKVTIKQGDVILRQQTVPPGAFEIRDIKPIGHGGDLDVTLEESDGQKIVNALPFTAAPQLLRPGFGRYWLAVGQAAGLGRSAAYEPAFAYAAGQRGFTNALTAYGGLLTAKDYTAVSGGGAVATRLGGISADLTFARNRRADSRSLDGASLRLAFNSFMPSYGTSVRLTGYRYSTGRYWSFSEALQLEDARRQNIMSEYGKQAWSPWTHGDRQRDRFEINLDQPLVPGWGRMFVSGSSRRYWNRPSTDTLYQMGYSGSRRGVNFSVSLGRAFQHNAGKFSEVMFSITVPLFGSGSTHSNYLSGWVSSRSQSGGQAQVEVSGAAGSRRQINYNVFSSRQFLRTGAPATFGLSAGYQGSIGNVYGGISGGSDSWQANLNGAGGLLIHDDGVIFGQTLGETVALVSAEGAGGVQIENADGARINSRGFGLVPYLSPYVRNQVLLDPEGSSPDLQLESSNHEVIPAAGAVVRIHVKTSRARSALLRVHYLNGAALPFGAEVRDVADGRTLGFVGQGGTAFLRGVERVKRVRIVLGKGRACEVELPSPKGFEGGEGMPSICAPFAIGGL
ncbi:fimbria/pilus outer membrane usher protein [Lysobacter sp. GCM10012299]|uniref:fimbria/pilus outer membrane usher protein n=1 Tax=Lysobacter sp. GCM10012299 TaxID=3317333 RepID=UPI00360869D6